MDEGWVKWKHRCNDVRVYTSGEKFRDALLVRLELQCEFVELVGQTSCVALDELHKSLRKLLLLHRLGLHVLVFLRNVHIQTIFRIKQKIIFGGHKVWSRADSGGGSTRGFAGTPVFANGWKFLKIVQFYSRKFNYF